MTGQSEMRCRALCRVHPFLGVEAVLEMPRTRTGSANRIVRQLELPARTISPLTLPHLAGAKRARLEACLLKRAFRIEYHWRMYPGVLDRAQIAAARGLGRESSRGGACE